MLLTSWLRGWFDRANAQRDKGYWSRRRPRPHEPRRRISSGIELLESRQLLTNTTFIVNVFADTVDANPGDGIAADAGGNTSLRAAIMEANALAGDQAIELPSGTYLLTLTGANEDGAATGDLDITDTSGPVTIRRTGVTEVTVDGNVSDRVFDVAVGAGLSLVNLTVRHGFLESGKGVGIRSQGQLTLDRVRVIDGTAGAGEVDGGGIAIESGFAMITDSEISDNSVNDDGGGLYLSAGSTTIVRSTLDGNEAGGFGGAIRNQGTAFLNVVASTISNNSATVDGGGISNTASFSMGGGSAIVDATTISSNSVSQATSVGAGIHNTGMLTVTRSLIAGNTGAHFGGGLFNTGIASVLNTTISTNVASFDGEGGGIYQTVSTASLFLDSVTLTLNSASIEGGGIARQDGTFFVQNTIIAGNIGGSTGNADVAGTISSNGHNLIGDLDGASGFSNGVNGDIVGGEIAVDIIDATNAAPIEITTNGAHGLVTGDRVRISGVTGNTAANGVFFVTFTSATTFTLDGSTGNGTYGAEGEVFRLVDPKLAALAENGGPTQTHALQMGSAAIDGGALVVPPFGIFLAPETDQRNAPRAINSPRDIGAFETGFVGFFVNTTDDLPDADLMNPAALDANGNTSLRAAVMQGNFSGGNRDIVIEPGIYTLTQTGTETTAAGEFGDLEVFSSNVHGFGSLATIVDANGIDRAFEIGNSTISGLSIRNGNAGTADGGGIFSFGNLTLIDVLVENSTAANGGGIASSGPLTAERIFLFNNNATEAGGGLFLNAFFLDSNVSNSSIGGNQSGAEGGGIALSGSNVLNLKNTQVIGNTAGTDGGGIAVDEFTTLSVFGGSVNQNTAMNDGGGIGSDGILNLQNAFVSLNTAGRDAGGLGITGTAQIIRSQINGNTAGRDAGGIGISNALGGFPMSDTLFGGSSADVLILASRIQDNVAADNAGGVGLAGEKSVRLEFTEVDGNQSNSGAGGGVFVSAGSITIEKSAIVENIAGLTGTSFGDGGGLYVTGGSTVLNNSTVSGNEAIPFNSQGGAGGGVMHAGGKLTVTSSTITDNEAALGGGLASFANSLPLDKFLDNRGTVQNTIIAENMAATGPDVFAPVNGPGAFVGSLGNNLIGIAGSGAAGANFINGVKADQVGTAGTPLDPGLGALAFNGGLTRTHAVQGGSPAIDAGIPTGDEVDQRGASRLINMLQDIGAYEFGFTGFFVNTTEDTVDANIGDGVAQDANGMTSLRAAIQESNALNGIQTIVLVAGDYKLSRTGANEDAAATGDLDVTESVNVLGYGAGITVIDGLQFDRLFDVQSNVSLTISDVTLTRGSVNGIQEKGGAIRSVASNLRLDRVSVTNNFAAGFGGAIYAEDGGATDSVLVRDSSFLSNVSGDSGGAIAVDNHRLFAINTRFEVNMGNGSGGGGGALLIADSVADIQGSVFRNNSGDVGGAVYADRFGGAAAKLTDITHSQFEFNTAGQFGGAIANVSQNLEITTSYFGNNSTGGASVGGGGIYNFDGTVDISNSEFFSNFAGGSGKGGAIHNAGTSANLALTGSTLASNSASAGGGLFHEAGTAGVTRTTLSGNFASDGGGISNLATLILTSSTLSENNAALEGGGLRNATGATATITQATFTLNNAPSGGGIFNESGGSATLKNTLVAGNTNFSLNTDADLSGSFSSAGSGGNNLIGDLDGATGFTHGTNGDLVGGVTSVAISSVTNAAGSLIRVTTSASHGLQTGDRVRIRGVSNVFQAEGVFTVTVIDADEFDLNEASGSGGSGGTGGTVSELIDSRLGTLRDNTPNQFLPPLVPVPFSSEPPVVTTVPRIATFTHELLPGSPAIDAGTNTGAPTFDQNSFPVPTDGNDDGTATADIGAFELYLTTVTGNVFSDANGNGVFDIATTDFLSSGRTVYLDANRNGQFDPGEPNTPTNGSGDYVLEFLFPNVGLTVDVVANPGERRTTPATPIISFEDTVTPASPTAMAVTDFDFDGDLEVVIVDRSNNLLQVFDVNATTGELTELASLSINSPADLQIADVDNDGLNDFIIVRDADDTVSIVRRTLFGFAAPIDVAVGDNPQHVAVGDLNGDQFRDLAVSNRSAGTVRVLLGSGGGNFTNGDLLTINGSMPGEVVIADFDLDGLNDIAVAFGGVDVVGVAYNTDFSFTTVTQMAVTGSPESLVVGDFDRDGLPDLATGTTGNDQVQLLRNRAFRQFDNPINLGTVVDPSSLAVIDFDQDGDPDLIAGSEAGNGEVTLLRNLGMGLTFSSFLLADDVGAPLTALAVADFNHDNRPDLVLGSESDVSLSVRENLTGAQVVFAETGVVATAAAIGFQTLGNLAGVIFNDLNNDGFQQFGTEPGLAGISLFLDTNGNGRQDPYEPVTGTSADDPETLFSNESGQYLFENLIPGNYRVYYYRATRS